MQDVRLDKLDIGDLLLKLQSLERMRRSEKTLEKRLVDETG